MNDEPQVGRQESGLGRPSPDGRARGPAAPTPAGIRRELGFFPELEALRGVAALLVAAYHADRLLAPAHDPSPSGWLAPLQSFVSAGHTGVTLFFVLSAFLLGRPYVAAARRGRAPSTKRFLARRALRILPLYAVAVALASASLAETPIDLRRGLAYLLFLQVHSGWVEPLYPWSAVWWSLATEAQFYLVLPAAGLLAASPRGRPVLVALGALALAAFYAFERRWLSAGTVEGQLALSLSLLGRAPAFAGGIAAAWLHERFGERLKQAAQAAPWMRRGGADLVLAGLALILGLLLARVARLGFWDAEAHWHVWHLYEAALWTAILLVLLLAPLRSRRLLAGGALASVGIVSYSLYLWHYPTLHAVLGPLRAAGAGGPGWSAQGLAAATLGLVLAFGVSTVTYRFVERPFLARKARIGG